MESIPISPCVGCPAHLSASQIASKYGIYTNVISRWRDQALAALPGAFNDQAATDQAAKEVAWEKEREELYAEIGKLSTQLAWMKKMWSPA